MASALGYDRRAVAMLLPAIALGRAEVQTGDAALDAANDLPEDKD